MVLPRDVVLSRQPLQPGCLFLFVFKKYKFVAYPDLSGRIYRVHPKTGRVVEFSLPRFWHRFFFVTIQTSWKYFGIVEDHGITIIKIFQYIFEKPVLNFFFPVLRSSTINLDWSLSLTGIAMSFREGQN